MPTKAKPAHGHVLIAPSISARALSNLAKRLCITNPEQIVALNLDLQKRLGYLVKFDSSPSEKLAALAKLEKTARDLSMQIAMMDGAVKADLLADLSPSPFRRLTNDDLSGLDGLAFLLQITARRNRERQCPRPTAGRPKTSHVAMMQDLADVFRKYAPANWTRPNGKAGHGTKKELYALIDTLLSGLEKPYSIKRTGTAASQLERIKQQLKNWKWEKN